MFEMNRKPPISSSNRAAAKKPVVVYSPIGTKAATKPSEQFETKTIEKIEKSSYTIAIKLKTLRMSPEHIQHFQKIEVSKAHLFTM